MLPSVKRFTVGVQWTFGRTCFGVLFDSMLIFKRNEMLKQVVNNRFTFLCHFDDAGGEICFELEISHLRASGANDGFL